MEDIDDNERIVKPYFNKPNLLVRIKSTMIDTVTVIMLMYLSSIILDALGLKSGMIRGFALILVLLYEPLLVVIDRTLGQRFMGLRVRKFSEFEDSKKRINVNIGNSILRYIVKIALGWISLLTIHKSTYGRAIHDKLGNSFMTAE